MKINIIILKYSRLSKEAEDVLLIIDFTPNIIIWLNAIDIKRAIASLFPILVFSIIILSCRNIIMLVFTRKWNLYNWQLYKNMLKYQMCCQEIDLILSYEMIKVVNNYER